MLAHTDYAPLRLFFCEALSGESKGSGTQCFMLSNVEDCSRKGRSFNLGQMLRPGVYKMISYNRGKEVDSDP